MALNWFIFQIHMVKLKDQMHYAGNNLRRDWGNPWHGCLHDYDINTPFCILNARDIRMLYILGSYHMASAKFQVVKAQVPYITESSLRS